MANYREAYTRSITDPDGFWRDAASAIDWERSPDKILDDTEAPIFRWFSDGTLNTCWNALDRHVETRGDQPALIYDSPVTTVVRSYTYREMRDQVALFAGALRRIGVEAGDRVVIYMAMVPEAVVAMLACARIGAVHSVVFGGFGARELAARIDDARPKVIVASSGGIEAGRIVAYQSMLDAACDEATHVAERRIILQRPQAPFDLRDGDLTWEDALDGAEPAGCVPVRATDPLYILYTSGTTGRPKGVVRDNGGHAVALRWSMENIFGVRPGDVFWAASDVGWVVGHSYIVYAPLLTGATTILYEGKPVATPDAGAFWRVAEQHRVSVLFTAPTAIRAIRREDPDGRLTAGRDLSDLRLLFLAGERLDPPTYTWAGDLLGIPVIDNWWQTETGWPIAASPRGIEELPTRPGSPSVPMPGYRVRVVDSTGADVPAGQEGSIVIGLPLPPGCLPTLWGDDERFVRSYLSTFQGNYLTGDGGRFDDDGYLYVLGRTDDVINVAGHRLSTGSMEEVLSAHPAVAECAVIGVSDPLKGQVPRGLVVAKAGVTVDPAELVAFVRERIGAVAALRRVDVVTALPKTRSGKILRGTMRGIADGRDEAVPSTIENPDVLDALRPVLRRQH
ncbi:putative acyl-CoA synthetase [Actinoplanes missouriensis 431]|uniref:Putative acyl-CoA synthetase n=1 Tax=Actinoplanes missouriensis (strain ATCC 14538 / DSM 43046 / CBS 188.64 / JCM 3121 / NBRC 102363 / NCIMB 12654 / NRRL B-3342 / UNCC 431) TaxID=512565 RepID=I0H7N4_ACTM4|nr:AMP-binding protein [Actinoplanes missouriensis]BAL89021.1 putative acyl-CoA synthetase [Actinoplanes missouriensis 431]